MENVDGVRGDSLEIGDEIVIPQDLVEKYKGDFAKAEELGKLITKEKPRVKAMEHAKKTLEEKTEVKSQSSYQKQPEKELYGLYMPGQEKPFGVWQKNVVNEKEKYYEELSGQNIKQAKVTSYSTPLSIKIPAKQTKKLVQKYLGSRLLQDVNANEDDVYYALDSLSNADKRQFIKDFERDFEHAKTEINNLYKQGKSIEQIVDDSSYAWVDKGLIGAVH